MNCNTKVIDFARPTVFDLQASPGHEVAIRVARDGDRTRAQAVRSPLRAVHINSRHQPKSSSSCSSICAKAHSKLPVVRHRARAGEQIDAIFDIERDGRFADERLAGRREHVVAIGAELQPPIRSERAKLSRYSDVAKAMGCMLKGWGRVHALSRWPARLAHQQCRRK
jgi:hypothetical protein